MAAAAAGSAATAMAIAVAPLAGAALLLRGTAAAQGHSTPLAVLRPIATKYRQQLAPGRELLAALGGLLRAGTLRWRIL